VYSLVKPLLFSLDPERAHHLTLDALKVASRMSLRALFAGVPAEDPLELWGLRFAHRVGLAAGLDKNGDYVDALGTLGFSFIELGTVTPLPQPGNPKPRLFRLRPAEALVNRMGFNNKGIDYLVQQVRARRYPGIVGINIGKNKTTPPETANDDYLTCLRKAYAHAQYIAVNVSSPNTPGLRDLQFGAALDSLLQTVREERDALAAREGRFVPLLLKIAPDVDERDVVEIADALLRHKWDGAIATNTTISREGVAGLAHADEAGGLSGKPLLEASTRTLRWLAREVAGRFPIIAVGGILTPEDAVAKLEAGATLVQIYSGLIYRGPRLIAKCAAATRRLSLAAPSPAAD
jgi:dihydroorotate dehydrogenase